MKRVFSDRGMGKTTSLVLYANELAKKYPNRKVYFVSTIGHSKNYIIENCNRIGISIEPNIKFISYMKFSSLNTGFSDLVVLDDVEIFLNGLGVEAYSLTMDD